jgi:hypothetical protein
MLADDFIEFGSSGGVWNKKQVIDGLQEEVEVVITIENFKALHLATDVVLATYIAINHGEQSKSLRSSIWKLTGDRWQMIFHQGTNK